MMRIERVGRRTVYAMVVVAVVCLLSLAQAKTVIDCSAFERGDNGRWVLLKETTVSLDGTEVHFGHNLPRGIPIRVRLAGVDIAALLERHCTKQ